jgi:DNA-binding MarR family transcriptional regulator
MSSKSEDLALLSLFGKVRRQLNLLATAALRPLEIGPKQAVLLREIRAQKALSLTELSRRTHTDPASTGKTIETLIRREWVKRTEDPDDRRRWVVSLTAAGQQAARQLETLYCGLAKDLCATMRERDREAFAHALTEISSHLERKLASPEEPA